MRAAKKAVRAMDGLAALLAQYGVDQETIAEIKETAPTDRNAISRQGEAVLLFLESPAKFTSKQCKRCGEYFGTNYRSVAYCSDNCRSRAMNDIFGMVWNWTEKSEEERWGGEPPLIIPPRAFAKLEQYVRWFNDHADRFNQPPLEVQPQTQPQIPSQSQTPAEVLTQDKAEWAEQTSLPASPSQQSLSDSQEEEDPFGF